MKSGYVKLLFLGIVFFLIAISVVTYKSLDDYIEEVRWVRHSSDVQETVERVISSIKDSEIGQYGYQLTRDSLLLEPFYASREVLPGVLKSLDSMVSDNIDQHKRVDTLSSLMHNQFRIVEEIIANAKSSQLYMDRYESGLIARSRANMNAIRAVGRRIRANEDRILEERSNSETGMRKIAPVSLLFYGLASLAGIAFLFSRVLDELEKRKKAEDSLRDNVQALKREVGIREFTQKTLRNVIDNSLDGIVAFRALRDKLGGIDDFECILVNSVGAATIMSTGTDVIGKRLLAVHPSVKADGLFETYARVVESGIPIQVERRHALKGFSTWYNMTAVKLEDGLVVTFADITAQKLQRMLIEEREELLKEAEQVANMGSWKWMKNTDELIWSDGLFRVLEKSRAEYKPSWKSFLDNVHYEDRPAMRNFLASLRVNPDPKQLEYRIDTNNSVRYLSMILKPLKQTNDMQPNLLGTVIDITERKIYENQLKQYTLELQRSNQDLEQFAYVASHDLQEPLRKIRAFGDLAAKGMVKGEESTTDYIQRMQSAAARMQVLIQDLLLFSRVSRSGNAFEPIVMNTLLDEVLEDLNVQIQREQARVVVGALPNVIGEPSQLRRLFQNIISNAIKFHKPDVKPEINVTGRVLRRAEILDEYNVSVGSRAWACYSIVDNGIGFEEKYAEKIFNIFQRLHGRNEYEGTGIGLSVCRKIASNHHGYIFAKSTENVGSEFVLILPMDRSEEQY